MRLQPIHKENWDYLIILDACRYDTFKKLYPNYLKGKLEKVGSRGSHTIEWTQKTFVDKYDYTYLSANPFINGKSLSLDELGKGESSSWCADNHFKKVIDLWDSSWDEKEDTVLPETVRKKSLEFQDETPLVIHFLQPHQPYIGFSFSSFSSNARKRAKSGKENSSTLWNLGASLLHLLPYENQQEVKQLLGIRTKSNLEKIYEEKGMETLKKCYRTNLQKVLKEIESLVENLEGSIVITSDHGESFGTKKIFGHVRGVDIPCLREVPWFEVKE